MTHFDGLFAGDNNLNGYTLGAYWTRFGPSGWYLDATVQGSWFDISANSHRSLATFGTHGVGFAGSFEGGYPLKFNNGYFIEPQVQIVYQNNTLSGRSDGFAAVRFDDTTSLAGRIGARFGRTLAIEPGPNPRNVTVWLRPNLWYEFLGDPLTQFLSATGFIPFRADLGGLWGEINGGVSGQINSYATAFANVSYQSRFDLKSSAYDGKIGLRINW